MRNEEKRRTGRRLLCAALTACLLPALSSCGSRQEEARRAVPTLGLPESRYAAPDGDEIFGAEREFTLYLPMKNGLTLTQRSVRLRTGNLHETVRSLLEALFAAPGDAEADPLGGGRKLSLYADRPVEISGSVCTVDLSGSVLQLNHSDLYKTGVAIATTLCALNEISFVNILAADQSVGMDISGSLPMGSLTAHPGENLPVLWEQMEARRTPLGDDMSKTPLSSLGTLYYPLPEGRGIGCEDRLLSFEGQTPQQLAKGLLEAICAVKRNLMGSAEPLDIRDMLMHDPLTSELEDGGRLITLTFREDAEKLIATWQTDMPCLIAAVSCTLMTYIPGIAAICVRVGDKPITELSSDRFERVATLGGLIRRPMLEPYLMGTASLFFEDDGRLAERSMPLERLGADNPRAQLRVLMEGPGRAEKAAGLMSTLPEGLTDNDVLGIVLEGDTMLVNLSANFRDKIRESGAERETLLCYSLVNTLCVNSDAVRVRFFFEGEQAEELAGSVYWAGEFLYNPALAQPGAV